MLHETPSPKNAATPVPRSGPYARMLAELRRDPAVARVTRNRRSGGHRVVMRRPAFVGILPPDHRWHGALPLITLRALTRGHGHGGHALDVLIAAADRIRLPLVLHAEPYGAQGLSMEQLVRFYERRGFSTASGRYMMRF